MTEKEYFETIKKIRRHITQNRLEQAKALLEEMYAYKPVRLLWFVAKAEYMLKTGASPGEALKSLSGKYTLSEDYPGLRECMKFRLNTLRAAGEEINAAREEYYYRRAFGKDCRHLENNLEDALERFAADTESGPALRMLANAFYRTADIISYLIVRMAMLRAGLLKNDFRGAWFYQTPNYGYLEEKVRTDEENTFILVTDEHMNRSLEILGFILHSFGHKVFLLGEPLRFETENRLDLKDTVAVSMEQMQRYPDLSVIPPVMLTQAGEPYGDNRDYIIDHLCREESGRDNVVVLCSGHLLEDLCVREGLRGRSGRLSHYETDYRDERLHFGWAGSYLSYISDIYGYDVRADLEAKPEVDFSILIPARNSAATLRYTLQTCLEQRYQGSYEIVVSDNSVDEDTSVCDLCRELGDPRIRYVKTPRLLQLTKSFEFGYLQTRGDFVLSIGSDDGLLPWTLEILKRVIDQYPGEDIIQWERGFYAWPGFNGGQEHQFVIPGRHEKNQVPIHFEETARILENIAQNTQGVYLMPVLYINSGFRRRYMKTLLEKTGKLWDGGNQDLQMGVVNCCMNSRVLQILYPLTIAGMCSTSVGYLESSSGVGAERERVEETKKRLYQQANLGHYTPLARERRLLLVGVDACSLYAALSRAVEEGLISEAAADRVLDWKTAVSRAFGTYSLTRDNYDLFVHRERFMAKKLGESYVRWFDQAVYQSVLTPRYMDDQELETARTQKIYQEGKDASGGETLDASKYGVRNIAEAVKLFAERTGL